MKKYHVAVTYEVWNGESTIEHDYDSAAQAAAVYERVCRFCGRKYRRMGYCEDWEQVFEVNEGANYTVALWEI